MPCGLNDFALETIYFLYKNRNVKSNRGKHEAELEEWFQHKFEEDIKNTLKLLLNEGYVGRIGKSPPKYFIYDVKKAFFALGSHAYRVTRGRIHPL